MSRTHCALAVMALLTIGTSAYAQEAGAGRLEIGVATGGGALFFAAGDGVSRFGSYAVGATVTFNLKPRIGVEGDFGAAGGRRQDLTFNQATLLNQRTPTVLNYNGALIFSPVGRQHRVTPYAAAGIGGLTMLQAPDTAALGLTSTRTFLTANTGGGVNWYPARHMGLRGDYRVLVIRNQGDAPVFFGTTARFAHRVYGAFMLTY